MKAVKRSFVKLSDPSANVTEATAPDPLLKLAEHIEQVEADPPADGDGGIWEESVSLGIALTGMEDETRWKRARLASMVRKKYGQNSLGKFASDTNSSVKTLRENVQIMNYFTIEAINEWREHPILRYTHFRSAMRVGEDSDSYTAAETFLRDCVEGDWSVSKAEVEADKRMGKKISPRKIAEFDAMILNVDDESMTIQVHDPEALAEFRAMYRDQRPISMKLFEVEQPAPIENDAGLSLIE